ncbi:TVP38/TMEM64 family inner membrane protein YdjZ [Nocardioides dokdonensis FR1436]|uniref:TVP38/TMEM64 family membrane protein n=2 Tax=Nocardioides TaxID=1839 RepID=A0A1A9GQ46_9ACTN|nr:TVP38/TMEM64 family inner membrane protein YdjZ [Nocardioides dokdonensis FR1436]
MLAGRDYGGAMDPALHDVERPTGLGRGAVVRLLLLAALLVALVVLWRTDHVPDVSSLRARVEDAGVWGPAVFVGGYAALALLPTPKGLMTALGAVLFGFVAGAALAWAAAMLAALVAFWISRLLGRDAVDRLTGGRLDRVDELFTRHGFAAVVAVRLVPVLPYTAINYASGLVSVGVGAYLAGTAVGMVPGSLAYAALGAFGTSPTRLSIGLAGFLAVTLLAAWVGRRMLRGRTGQGPDPDRGGGGG